MSIAVRSAVVEDVQWIEPLLKKGALDGHFAPTVGMQGGMLVLAALHGAEINMMRLRDGKVSPAKVRATIYAAELDAAPSAFLLALKDETGIELHLAATKTARVKVVVASVMQPMAVYRCHVGARSRPSRARG